jgi:hypothetical protein
VEPTPAHSRRQPSEPPGKSACAAVAGRPGDGDRARDGGRRPAKTGNDTSRPPPGRAVVSAGHAVPRARACAFATAAALAVAACGAPAPPSGPDRASTTPPSSGPGAARSEPPPATAVATAPEPAGQMPAAAAPAHTVIVMMENHSYSEVIGNAAAPYPNGLARQGALFTDSYGVTHPSQPNYLALFSGSTQGITSDSCPPVFTGPNLASELVKPGGYSERITHYSVLRTIEHLYGLRPLGASASVRPIMNVWR